MDIPDLTPLQWAFAVVLLLLAMAGIYYLYTLCCGYRCLPLETAACEGGEPHFLVYVTGPEKAALAKIAKHKGPPPLCHGIDSYPKEDVPGDVEVDHTKSVMDMAKELEALQAETAGTEALDETKVDILGPQQYLYQKDEYYIPRLTADRDTVDAVFGLEFDPRVDTVDAKYVAGLPTGRANEQTLVERIDEQTRLFQEDGDYDSDESVVW